MQANRCINVYIPAFSTETVEGFRMTPAIARKSPFQMHLSTAVVLMTEAAMLMYINMMSALPQFCIGSKREIGFPFVAFVWDSHLKYYRDYGDVETYHDYFVVNGLCDLLIVVCILAGSWLAIEWAIRSDAKLRN